MAIKKHSRTQSVKSFIENYRIKATSTNTDSEYQFPKAEIVPEGKYHAKLTAIQEVKLDGTVVGVDILHNLTAVGDGTTYHVRQRYLCDCSAAGQLEDFANLLAGYGLEGQPLSSAVGVEENVTLTYHAGETFGTFNERQKTERNPRSAFGHNRLGKSKPPVDLDDEDDEEDFADDVADGVDFDEDEEVVDDDDDE